MSETKAHQATPCPLPADLDPTGDYELWLRLKPYIGHCLTMNHDVNNSLTAVLGFAELMLEDDPPLTEKQIGHVKAIIRSAERVQATMENLCQEKIELSERIDLGPVIEAYQRIANRSE